MEKYKNLGKNGEKTTKKFSDSNLVVSSLMKSHEIVNFLKLGVADKMADFKLLIGCCPFGRAELKCSNVSDALPNEILRRNGAKTRAKTGTQIVVSRAMVGW